MSMEDGFRNVMIGIATSLSVAAIGVGINTYVDVQVLKNSQTEQRDVVKSTQDILNRIDKTQAVQTETIKTLSEVVNSLRDSVVDRRGDKR